MTTPSNKAKRSDVEEFSTIYFIVCYSLRKYRQNLLLRKLVNRELY
jgi:hypothetical protein